MPSRPATSRPTTPSRCARFQAATRRSVRASRPDGGVIRGTWPAPSCSWPRLRAITYPGTSWWWTAAGWRAEHAAATARSGRLLEIGIMRYLPSPNETRGLSTDQLRAAFLVEDLFIPDEVILRGLDLDRVILGGAVPISGPLRLEPSSLMAAQSFTERRELGVLNIGAPGAVLVDGQSHALARDEMLYIGRGSREIVFASDTAARPAYFY